MPAQSVDAEKGTSNHRREAAQRWHYSRRLRGTITKIAALKARQARRRLDFTHKLPTDLTKNHGGVAIEDLRVNSMTRTARGTVETPAGTSGRKPG